MLQSKQRIRQLEQDIGRMRNMLPRRDTNKHVSQQMQHQNIDSITMMEEGKLAKDRSQVLFEVKDGMQDLLLQSNGKTTLTHESNSTAKSAEPEKLPQVNTNIQNSTMENLCADEGLPNDPSLVESAVSLRAPDADIPRSLILNAEKRN